MQAYRLEAIVLQNGELQLERLPFRPGEIVEVIVLSLEQVRQPTSHFPLKGTVLSYEEPKQPVAENDWDILQ